MSQLCKVGFVGVLLALLVLGSAPVRAQELVILHANDREGEMKVWTRVGLCGAAAGALNAALCYAQLPVKAAGETFSWYVIPAGAFHGGILTAIAASAAQRLRRAHWPFAVAGCLLVGWVGGALAWIPLNHVAFDKPWLQSATWPFHEDLLWPLFSPLLYLGFVAVLYCLTLSRLDVRGRRAHAAVAIGSGVLGSLWFWIAWTPWYLSPLHGTVWGTLVGLGASREVGEHAGVRRPT